MYSGRAELCFFMSDPAHLSLLFGQWCSGNGNRNTINTLLYAWRCKCTQPQMHATETDNNENNICRLNALIIKMSTENSQHCIVLSDTFKPARYSMKSIYSLKRSICL